ncbi:MAG: THO complex subunit 2, partial [Candelina submexicana]
MAPSYGSKRKRGDRSYSQGSNDDSRPSPHRPDNLDLAQQSHSRPQLSHHDYRESSERRFGRDTYIANSPGRGGHDVGPFNRGGRSGPPPGRGGHGIPPHSRSGQGPAQHGRGGHNTSPPNRGGYGPAPLNRGNYGMPPHGRGVYGGPPPSRGGHGSAPTSPLSSANSIPLPSRGFSNSSLDIMPPPPLHRDNRHEPERVNNKANPREPPPPNKPEAPTYPFEYVTTERLSYWNRPARQSGRRALIDTAVQGTLKDMMIIFQEILTSGLTSRLDANDAGTLVKDIIAAVAGDSEDFPPERALFRSVEKYYPFLDCLSAIPESEFTNPRLRVLVIATKIPSVIMRHVLSFQLLLSLDLIRDTFDRVAIRKQTNTLYRQSNYNLQREESEGYSKLMTELFTTSGEEIPTDAVVTKSLERVKGLIGTYDLDAGRVLDVTLDVFAAVLVKHYRFFVKFLRFSSWWPHNESSKLRGNSDAAQLLGFKLRFYTSPARNEHDTLPINLIYLAALLIKIGFISLEDLYPHLWPADEDFEALRLAKAQERAENEKKNLPGGGAQNALARAPVLPDDTIPTTGGPREVDSNKVAAPKADPVIDANRAASSLQDKDSLPEPSDQKVQLLKSLLCIGALSESLFILGRFPWLMDAFPELPDHLHRIIHHCIEKVYAPSRPLLDRGGIRAPKKIPDPDQTGVSKGQSRMIDIPARRTLRWAQMDKIDTNEATDYRFYWDDWADDLPVCQDIDGVFELCESLVNYSGVKIGRDATLLIKLTRIGKRSLEDDMSPKNEQRWIGLCKRLLVPALSLTYSNPAVVNEVFDLLRSFRTEIRFSMYAEWNSGPTSRLPDIKVASDRARAETKDILKRISKTNVKERARALAKITCASPGVVFDVALGQIEAYDNLVEVVVECVRNTTKLGYDVLTWSLMRSLGTKGRNRVQADGMLTSKWLLALSMFAGKVFRRYPEMDPSPILLYVASQLEKGNPTDLVVLKELITSMAGIVSGSNFSDGQLQAMAGGELLQAQTLQQLGDRRHATEVKASAQRLIKALSFLRLSKPGFLAHRLIVGIVRQRSACLLVLGDDDHAPLKVLGNLYDGIDEVFNQFLDLVRLSASGGASSSLTPTWDELRAYNGVPQEMAFIISRRALATDYFSQDNDTGGTPASPAKNPPFDPIYGWRPEYFRCGDASGARPSFYVTFWLLTLSDMLVPTQSYEDEINRQKRVTVLAKSASNDIQDRLRAELKAQVHSFSQTRSRLQKEKDSWFDGTWGRWGDLNEAILVECFLPRLRLSPVDALYTFRMLKYLHGAGTPNFRTLGFIDILFKEAQLTTLVHVCTSNEAASLGRFFSELLKDLKRWHGSKSVYEKEAYGSKGDLPGFAVKLVDDRVPETFLDFEDFRRVLLKWHKQLHGALKTCLTSGEYMHIHNAITILNAVHTSFPAVNWIGEKQTQYLIAISKNERRNDLKLAATSLLGALKGQEKNWLMPQQFSVVGPARTVMEAQQVLAKEEPVKETEAGEDGEIGAREGDTSLTNLDGPSVTHSPLTDSEKQKLLQESHEVGIKDVVSRKEPRSTPATREPAMPMAPHPDREAMIMDRRERPPPPRHDHQRSLPPRRELPPPARDEGRRPFGGPPTGPRSDPNYGRLNPDPVVPSGPRSQTGAPARGSRAPPTGPYTSSGAEGRRGDRRLFAGLQHVLAPTPPRGRDDDRRRE